MTMMIFLEIIHLQHHDIFNVWKKYILTIKFSHDFIIRKFGAFYSKTIKN